MVGKNLSHYKILEELGRGGMGIVYKAEDTKLDRIVAIKVLPTAALSSGDDRARFYREAKAAAQLHHPHIASIFGIDEAIPDDSAEGESRPFIAMEFVEGDTLHERVQKGPLKLTEAVQIAIQIASGLEVAHDKDIVHRDIKSGNVMLAEKGGAKILDFGLAQTAQSTKLTRMGSTLGTVAYMSPEQARGDEVDRRSDLYSLGTVLYEMVAGRLPFSAEYEQAAIYSILNEEPEPLTAVRTGIPMALEAVVTKALRKDASLRYQNAADFIADLKALNLASTQVSGSGSRLTAPSIIQEAPRAKRFEIRTLTYIALAALLGLLLGILASNSPESAPSGSAVLFAEPVGERLVWALSPDGGTLAFVRGDTLWARPMDSFSERPVTRISRNALALFWAPSSERIGIVDGDEVRSIRPDGSGEIRIGEIPPVEGVDAEAWSTQDSVYLLLSYGGANAEIVSMPGTGGAPSSYWEYRASEDEAFAVDMFWHEPAKSLVATMAGSGGGPGSEESFIQILNPSSDRFERASQDLMAATKNVGQIGGLQYDPAGNLLFSRDENTWIVPVDSETLQPTGNSRFLLSNFLVTDVASTGVMLGRALPSQLGFDLILFNPDTGDISEITASDVPLIYPSFSPDGRYVVGSSDGTYIIDLERRDRRPIFDRVASVSVWLPMESGITASIYTGVGEGGANIYRLDPDGIDDPIELIGGDESEFYAALSPDQGTLMYYVSGTESGRDLWKVDVSIDQGEIQLLEEPSEWFAGPNEDVMPAWHSSGEWILYSANHTGEYRVYLREYPTARQEIIVTTSASFDPAWSPDGQQIYFRDSDSLYVVDVLDPETMRLSRPRGLLDINSARILATTPLERVYAVHPITGELLMNRASAAFSDLELRYVTNWRGLLED